MFLSLALMDTSLPENLNVVLTIKKEAFSLGLTAAFLESAPQLILQSSIILRTGYTSMFKELNVFEKMTKRQQNLSIQTEI